MTFAQPAPNPTATVVYPNFYKISASSLKIRTSTSVKIKRTRVTVYKSMIFGLVYFILMASFVCKKATVTPTSKCKVFIHPPLYNYTIKSNSARDSITHESLY